MKKILTMLVISLLLLSMIFVAPQTHALGEPAKIWTDKEDYAPTEAVTIFGWGFEPLANVAITIERPDGTSDTVFNVTNDVGGFVCTYQLNGMLGTYTVTATDGTNTATTTFTEGVITPELWGYTLEPHAGWTHGDVKGYYECQWVPYKIEVENTKKESYQLTVVVHHDYNDSTWLGLDNVRNFVGPGSISGPAVDGWESGIQQLQWSWTFTINKDETCTLSFEVHVAIGAHNYPGSKVHTHIHDIIPVPDTSISGGHRDVPIVVKGPPPPCSVTFYTDPSTVGSITFKTNTYTNGQSDTFSYGTSDLATANPPANWAFVHWEVTGNVGVSSTADNPTTVTITCGGSLKAVFTKVQYQITVTASPAGAIGGTFDVTYTQCGTTYTNVMKTTTWTEWVDANTDVAVSSPEDPIYDGPDTRYTFDHCDPSASVTMTGPTTITLVYTTQYYLTVVSPYDTPGGEGWYDEGTTAYATLATGTVDITPGWMRAVFINWIGDASGTGLTSDPIIMNGPKTAIANWKIQYYLDVVTDPSHLPPIPGAEWYDNCTWVRLTAPQYVPSEAGEDGVRYVFSYWDVDGTSQGIGVNPIDIHMNEPHIATAHYTTQYYLTVRTDPLGLVTIPGEGWYDKCTYVTLTAPPLVPISPGVRYRFDHWDVDTVTATSNPIDVHMDVPHTATAHYVKQYYLTVTDNIGGLSDVSTQSGWYDGCTYVPLTAPPLVQVSPGIRYRFDYWDVDTTTVLGNPITVHMDAPHTATAHYVKQYYLTVKTDPEGLDPAPIGEGWYDECTTVDIMAPPVSYLDHTEYVFVHWDIDNSVLTSEDLIHVHMDMPHTVTAHYWLPRPRHLDAEPPLLINLSRPVCTQWDELYPEYSRSYHLQSWYDTNFDGRLSPSDYIDLWDMDHDWKVRPYFWHMDDITVTLKVRKINTTETMYIEFEGGWAGYYDVITLPESTQWHEVYPNYCRRYHLEKWFDNCDSELSYCDRIILRDKETGERAEYHVEEAKTDLIISPQATHVILCKMKDFVGKHYSQVICEIIHNYYGNTTAFTVCAYYNGLQPIGNQTIILNPLESGDAIIAWTETSTWPMGTYSYNVTINTYANGTLLYSTTMLITFKITIVGDINGDGKVDLKDVYTGAKAFGSYLAPYLPLGHPRWDPNVDVNNDLKVDLKDYYTICKNFGKVDP